MWLVRCLAGVDLGLCNLSNGDEGKWVKTRDILMAGLLHTNGSSSFLVTPYIKNIALFFCPNIPNYTLHLKEDRCLSFLCLVNLVVAIRDLRQGSPILADCMTNIHLVCCVWAPCWWLPQSPGLEPTSFAPMSHHCTFSSLLYATQKTILLLLFCDFKIFFIFMSQWELLSLFSRKTMIYFKLFFLLFLQCELGRTILSLLD